MDSPLRVLYVDDEPVLLDIGKVFLEQSGDFAVTTATNAQDALLLLEQEQFDAIISDYQMPGLDGIQFLVEVRTRFGAVPFILFTGKGREEVVIQAINSGADFYLQKGGDPSAQFAELVHKIKSAVERKSAEKKLLESEEKYRTLVLNMQIGMVVHGPDTGILFSNPRASQILGLTPDQMRGKTAIDPAWRFIREDGMRMALEEYPVNRALASTEPLYLILGILRPDREGPTWVQCDTHTSRSLDGKFQQIVITFIDITERKVAAEVVRASHDQLTKSEADLRIHQIELEIQAEELRKSKLALEESLDKYLDLYDFAPLGYLTLSDKGLITNVNLTGATLLGIERSKLFSAPFSKCITEKDVDQWYRYFRKVKDRDEKLSCTFMLARGDGSVFPARLEGVRTTGSGGAITVRVVISDITDIRQAEEELRRQSATLSILNGIISTSNKADDLSHLLTNILSESLRMLDFDAGGIYLVDYATRIANVVHSKNLPPEFLAEIQTVPIDKKPYDTLFIQNEPIFTENYAQMAPDHSNKFGFQSMVSIPLLSKGVVIGALNLASTRRHVISEEEKKTLISISRELGGTIERMTAEEEVKKARKNLETLFNSIDEMVFVLDMQGCIIVVNEAVQKRLSYTSEELTGTNVLLLHVPERRDEALHIVQGMIAGTIDSCPVPVLAKDGTRIEVETKVTKGLWNNQEVLIGVSRDVTERMRAEEALAESEKRFTLAINGTGAGLWDWDMVKDQVVYSNQWKRMLGYEAHEVEDSFSGWKNLWHPEDCTTIEKALDDYLAGKTRHYEIIHRLRHKDGDWRWILTRGDIVKDAQGKPVRWVGTNIDITERKRAEEALKDNYLFMQTLVQTIPIPVFIKNRDGKYTDCNKTFETYFGRSRGEIIGRTVHEVSPKEIADEYFRTDEDLINHPGTQHYAWRVVSKNGQARDVIIDKATIMNSVGEVTGIIGVMFDITDRKQAEDAVLAANKKLNLLNSVTRHDVLNQITVLAMTLELIEESVQDAGILDFVKKAEGATERITRQIEFTREYQDIGVLEPQWQNVSVIIANAKDQLTTCPYNLRVDLGAVEIYADPLLPKVFYNLLENAIRHGEHVSTVRFSSRESDQGLTLVCEDNGAGVDAASKKHLFQQGFGKHTGFGLYLMREILSITCITITETGEPGKGARFEIAVPKGAWRTGNGA
jgi:PAS domain S-box-containing protein